MKTDWANKEWLSDDSEDCFQILDESAAVVALLVVLVWGAVFAPYVR
jgi:hypothetical protein